MSQVPLFVLSRLLSSLWALALEALLIGVHCKKRYINVQIQYNTKQVEKFIPISWQRKTQVKSSIRLLCKCQRETDYILIIAVTDTNMMYRELSKLTLYYFTKGKDPHDKLGGRFTH